MGHGTVGTHFISGGECDDASARSALLTQRLVAASHEYRMRLSEKAATMRAAVRDGETGDRRVLTIAGDLERLAGPDTPSMAGTGTEAKRTRD
jgi:hypothetical protein